MAVLPIQSHPLVAAIPTEDFSPSGGTCFFLAGVAEFLADDAAKRRFQRLLSTANVLPESIVDQRLIVAAARSIHLLPKPVEKVVIEPDRDSGLALGYWHDGSTLCAAEVVFTFHYLYRMHICAPL